MENQDWKNKEYSHFSHKTCEFYPCHSGADPERFNCLFCYCPLYILGDQCGGNFIYLPSGYKDCSACLFPHQPENYGTIISRYGDIMATMAKLQKKNTKE